MFKYIDDDENLLPDEALFPQTSGKPQLTSCICFNTMVPRHRRFHLFEKYEEFYQQIKKLDQ